MCYLVQVRRLGKKKWRTVTVTPMDWSVCNIWLGENYRAFPEGIFQRRIWRDASAVADASPSSVAEPKAACSD